MGRDTRKEVSYMLSMFLVKMVLLVVVYAAMTLLFCWGWRLAVDGNSTKEANCYNFDCQNRRNMKDDNPCRCDCKYCFDRFNDYTK